jgi:hypothetical protein
MRERKAEGKHERLSFRGISKCPSVLCSLTMCVWGKRGRGESCPFADAVRVAVAAAAAVVACVELFCCCL